MNLLLSDHSLPHKLPRKKDTYYIDLTQLTIKNCLGCFGCWVKTPGKCVIRDDAVKIYPLIAQSSNVIYVSKIFCGCYDEPMKRMLERAIPIQQAFIRLHQGETHHIQRNVTEKKASIIAYGCDSLKEQEIFQRLVARNARNMMFSQWKVSFVSEDALDNHICQEVEAWGNF